MTDTETEITDAPEVDSVEVQIDSQDPPENQENEPEKKAFNPKTDKVEFDKPEQQARFNEVFRDLKKSDQRNQMLTDFLQEQQRQIDELRSATQEIKAEKIQLDQVEAEKLLMSKIRTARDEGDMDAYDAAYVELTEFRASKAAQKIIDQKVNELSQKDSTVDAGHARYIASLMEERGASGEFVRPWLQETHPEFTDTIQQLAVIAYKYNGDPNQLQKSLSELDRIKGAQMKKDEPPKTAQTQQRAPNPLQGSNLTNQKPKGTIKMTRAEQTILNKLQQHSGRKIDLQKYAARRDAMYKKEGQ